MSHLVFDRTRSALVLGDAAGNQTVWPAYNNVDSRSKGPWPPGRFPFEYWVSHRGDPPSSAYGAHGVLVFDVPGREGMGVHAGRLGCPDGRGRSGPRHATMGCIRTTEDAMAAILDAHADDPLTEIEVA